MIQLPRRLRTVGLFFFLLSGVSFSGHAQPSGPRDTAPRGALPATDQRKLAKTSGRFLGWNFARQTHQDARRWQPSVTAAAPAPPLAGKEASRPELTAPGKHLTPLSGGTPGNPIYAGFDSAERLPSGTLPTAVVAGDFNGDGTEDLAISNGADDTVTVLLGNGAGGFQGPPGLLYTLGNSPVWITAAKLTANGHLDLIVTDGDSQQVEIFRGNGDGTFQKPYALSALAQTPTDVIAADFNGDGHLDIAVGLVPSDASNRNFVIYWGDGSGAFAATTLGPVLGPYGNVGTDTSLKAADLNKDGRMDLVVVWAGVAVVNLNQGGTTFTAIAPFGPTDGLLGLALGDVDGDGCIDAVETSSTGLLSVAKGSCDGNFTQAAPLAEVGDLDPSVLLTDVDGDGHLDVVASAANFDFGNSGGGIGAAGGYTISVFRGDGTGNFAPASIYRGAADQYSLTAPVLTPSGRPDIIAVAQSGNVVLRLSNDGRGGFGAAPGETIGYVQHGFQNAPSPSSVPQARVVDLNGDAKLDVLLVENGTSASAPAALTALLNDGTGKFAPAVRSPIVSSDVPVYSGFVAGNFRSQHAADVIYLRRESEHVVDFYPGNGNGSFGKPTTIATLPDPQLVEAGDFNHDGKLDFVVCGTTGNVPLHATIDAYLGNGDGTFLHSQTFLLDTTAVQQLLVADFNHDGTADLLLRAANDDLQLALGNGDGTFRTPTTLFPAFGPVAIGDFNHDGFVDLVQSRDPNQTVTTQALAGSIDFAPAATVYLGQANGQFVQGSTYPAPQVQFSLASPAFLGDFDGDGNLDVAILYASVYGRPLDFQLQIFSGAGDGTLRPGAIPYQLPLYDQPLPGGDFRGTGRTDLLDLIGSTSSIHLLTAGTTVPAVVTFDALPLPPGGGTATVTLAEPAVAGQTFSLTASDPAVQVPATLSFQAGETQHSFSYTIGTGFDTSHMLNLSAAINGHTANAYASIPSPNISAGVLALVGLIAPANIVSVGVAPGGSLDLVLSLVSQNGYSGNFDSLTCTGLAPGGSCSFAASELTLRAGGTTDTAFRITASPSTPLGIYPVKVVASNGALSASATVNFGVGDFNIAAAPDIIDVNDSTNQPQTTISANFLDGYTKDVTLSCAGLPAGATCYAPIPLFPGSSTTSLQVVPPQAGLATGDYPFTITASSSDVTRSIPATLRVESLSGTLSQSSLTLRSGVTSNLTVTLQSLNHLSNSNIRVLCATLPSVQLVAAVQCTANPQYAALTDGGTAQVQLSVMATLNPSTANNDRPAAHLWQVTPWLACLLLPLGWRRRRSRGLLISLCILGLTLGISSCGGSASSAQPPSGGGTSSPGGVTNPIELQVYASAPTADGIGIQRGLGTVSLNVSR